MKIHLARTSALDFEMFNNVLDILNSHRGRLEFTADPDNVRSLDDVETISDFEYKKFRKQKEINPYDPTYFGNTLNAVYSVEWRPDFPKHVKTVSWSDIFRHCEELRSSRRIPGHEILCLLMTQGNDQNWFYAWDTSGSLNLFVDSGQWEFFIPCDPRFPIAYCVAAGILQRLLFENLKEKARGIHEKPIGCINDFCRLKKDITLKMRTADICPDCMKRIEDKKIDPQIVDQVLKIMDSIRGQMLFRERFKITRKPSRIEVRGRDLQIFFPDLSHAELRLTPLEKTLYLFYLKHPEGVPLTHLSNHREEIEGLYKQVKPSYTVAEFRNSIDQLLDPVENSASEKLSKIKKKIIELTSEEMSACYLIGGQRGEAKRILLDRSLVVWN